MSTKKKKRTSAGEPAAQEKDAQETAKDTKKRSEKVGARRTKSSKSRSTKRKSGATEAGTSTPETRMGAKTPGDSKARGGLKTRSSSKASTGPKRRSAKAATKRKSESESPDPSPVSSASGSDDKEGRKPPRRHRSVRSGSSRQDVRSKAAPRRRAVLVGGARTPFVKAFGQLMELDSIALAGAATAALLERTGAPRSEIEAVVWGGVILPAAAPNIAREVALDLRLPASAEGMTVTRACASGLQAITLAVASIERGEHDVVIAGGSDSTSNAQVALPPKAIHALAPLAFGKAKSIRDYLGVLSQLTPITDILPKMPKIAERTTGEVMGESAERMARRNGIGRDVQDAFALRSHERAAAAIASGRFDREVAPVQRPDGERVYRDDIVRGDTSLAKLAKLRPAFASDGTVTAGNASPLTDGAAAVLLMSEDKARALGLSPMAAFRSWAYVGVDPSDQLLIGPALAIPKALERAGMSLADADLVDLHEAFAAQVLSVTKALGSDAFAKERLGRDTAVGEIDPERLNVHGGSIAIGHPFGATGARMVTTMACELQERDAETALLGICAAGGLGAAAVMERV